MGDQFIALTWGEVYRNKRVWLLTRCCSEYKEQISQLTQRSTVFANITSSDNSVGSTYIYHVNLFKPRFTPCWDSSIVESGASIVCSRVCRMTFPWQHWQRGSYSCFCSPSPSSESAVCSIMHSAGIGEDGRWSVDGNNSCFVEISWISCSYDSLNELKLIVELCHNGFTSINR